MNQSSLAKKAQSEVAALFVSDIHLSPNLPKTTEAFLEFLDFAQIAPQLFILGDLFEYWVGDDAIDTPYVATVIQALRTLTDSGTQIFWIAGNRDFLVGERFAHSTGAQLLTEPAIITIGDQRICLLHGDAQCTDDHGYMAFRSQVRQNAWQTHFLSKPFAERQQIVEGLRQGSKMQQKDKSMEIMDVNEHAISEVFSTTNTDVMIHGHTHRPAVHQYHGQVRYVLPDWQCDENPVRGGWLIAAIDGSLKVQNLGNSKHTPQ